MFKKHYISILVVVLSILGMVSQKQTIVPNQEIVLQFTNVSVETAEVANIVLSVKHKLKELGATQVKVTKDAQGTLRIAYYTASNVSSIKEKLSSEGDLIIDFKKTSNTNSLPENNEDIACNFDVYEIQKSNGDNWDLNGVNVSNTDFKSDHFFNPNVIFSNASILNEANSISKEKLQASKYITLAVIHYPYKTPEVRAGPFWV